MPMEDARFDILKERLEQLEWPSVYMFKFIVPVDKEGEVARIFGDEKVSYKYSEKGKFVSLTSKILIYTEGDVIDIYKKAAQIEGVIAL